MRQVAGGLVRCTLLVLLLTPAARPGPAAGDEGTHGTLQIVPQLGHAASVDTVAISDDGTLGLSGDGAGAIKVWDLASNLLLRDLVGHTEPVASVAFVPGGRQAISGSGDETVRLWDLVSGEPLHVFEGHRDGVRSVVVTADGRYAFSCDADGVVVQWDLDARTQVRRLEVEGSEISAIAVVDGGRRLVHASAPLGGRRTTLTVVDPEGVDADRRLTTTRDVVAWMSVRGDRLVAGNVASVVQVFASRSGVRLRRYALKDVIDTHHAVLSPDGERLAAATNHFGLRLYDAANGRSVVRFDGNEGPVTSLALSPDGTRALTGGSDGAVIHWDLEARGIIRTFASRAERAIVGLYMDAGNALAVTGDGLRQSWDLGRGELASNLRMSTGGFRCVAFASDGGHMVVSTTHGNALWPVGSEGGLVRSLGTHSDFDKSYCPVRFSDDGRLAMTAGLSDGFTALDHAGLGGNPVIFDRETAEPLTDRYRQGRWAVATAFLPDDRLLSRTRDDELEVWRLDNGRTVRTLGSPDDRFTMSVDATRDGRLAATGGSEGTITLWDPAAGERLGDLPGDRVSIQTVRFSPDDRWLAVTSQRDEPGAAYALEVWDPHARELITELDGLAHPVHDLAFSNDQRHVLLTDGGSGVLHLWRLSTGHVMSMVADDDAWAIYTNDGFFDTSRRGSGLIAAVDGLRAYRADHAGLGANRPDRVLQDAGIGDPDAIVHFHAVHRWRAEKHGLRGQAVRAPPEARIVEARLEGEAVQLTCEFAAQDAGLAAYRIYVNDVPVNGSAGTAIEGEEARVEVGIDLAPGRSKVEIEALDSRGAASLRPHRLFELERPSPITGDLYFLGFGVSRYRDSRLDLGYAHKDVLDLTRLLGFADGKFAHVYRHAHVDAEVTADDIRDARQHLEGSRVEDTVVLFVAGHGVYAGPDGDEYYFLTHDTDLERIAETAASFELFEELLDGIAPRRKLFLIDTCESGERSEVELAALDAGDTVEGARARTARGLSVQREKAAGEIRRYRIDQSRLIYRDLVRRTGSIVISSSRGSELSYERDDLQNGVFTEEILNALMSDVADVDRDGLLTTEELRAYITGAVAALTADRQHPTVDRDNLEQVFALPLVTNATLD